MKNIAHEFVAVIPAAGVGTRLRPHTHTVPKALINVAGRPILAHILDDLLAKGIRRYVIVIGYMGERIEAYVRSHYDIDVTFVEQETRQGLGHALYLTREAVGEKPMLVVLGDTIVRTNYTAFLDPQDVVLGVKEVEDPRRFGIVEIREGYVRALVEKPEQPRSNLALVGIYGIPRSAELWEALEEIIRTGRRTKGEYQLTDALALMLERGVRMRVELVDGWFDCGKPETLLDTNRHLLEGVPEPAPRPGVVFVPPVYVDDAAVLEQCILGPYVSVAKGATVRRSILRDSIVNENAVVEDVLLDGSVVGEKACVQGAYQSLNVGDSSEIRPSRP
jgi:glucose-1-phosphate thymidylyltransferase